VKPKERARQLKVDIPAVFVALKKKETPLLGKILAAVTVLLILLTMAPLFAHATASVQTYSLTRLFGIENVSEVLFYGTGRICAINVQVTKTTEKSEWLVIDVTFADIAEERVLGEARFGQPNYYDSRRATQEGVRFMFMQYDDETEEDIREEVTVTTDGEAASRILSSQEGELFLMPDGSRIMEWDHSLYFLESDTSKPRMLLAGKPNDLDFDPWEYDDDFGAEYDCECDDECDDVHISSMADYRFFEALDAYRFVYGRQGWEEQLGCGIYDLQNGEDLLLDNTGMPRTIHEGKLYTTTAIIDLETYQRQALPQEIVWMMNYSVENFCALSPDGQTVSELVEPYTDESRLDIYKLSSGELLESIPLGLSFYQSPVFLEDGALALCGLDRENQEWIVLIIQL